MIRHKWTAIIFLVSLGLIWGCGSPESKDLRVGANAELTGSKPTPGPALKKPFPPIYLASAP